VGVHVYVRGCGGVHVYVRGCGGVGGGMVRLQVKARARVF